MLLVIEERLKTTDFVERFKLAVISADPQKWTPQVFPNWVTAKPGERTIETEADLEEIDFQGPAEWVLSDDGITPEEAQRSLEEMLNERSGMATLDPDGFSNWEG